MKKNKLFATALCVLCASSLTFYSLNAQDPNDPEYTLPEASITCNQHRGNGALCWEWSNSIGDCIWKGQQRFVCIIP